MRTPVDNVLNVRMPISLWAKVIPSEEVCNRCRVFHSSELADLQSKQVQDMSFDHKMNKYTYFAITNSEDEVTSPVGGAEPVHCIF